VDTADLGDDEHGDDAGLGGLATLLADAGTAIAAVDVRGRLQMLSPEFEKLLARPFSNVPAAALAETYHVCSADGRQLSSEELPIVRALHGETVRNEVLSVTVPGLPERFLRVSAVPRLTQYGDRNGAWAVATDVTAIVAAARGEPQDRAITTVNHHLRTPLAIILGYAEVLGEREDLPEDVRDGLAAIGRAAHRLDDVVDWISALVEAQHTAG
jgi:signal transduction histidine kinase